MTSRIDWLPSFVCRATAALESGGKAVERGANFALTLADMTRDVGKAARSAAAAVDGSSSPADTVAASQTDAAPAARTFSRNDVFKAFANEADRLQRSASRAWKHHHHHASAIQAQVAASIPAATDSASTPEVVAPTGDAPVPAAPAAPDPEAAATPPAAPEPKPVADKAPEAAKPSPPPPPPAAKPPAAVPVAKPPVATLPVATLPAATKPPAAAATPVSSVSGGLMMGINLAGGEFGSIGSPYGTSYIYPSRSEVDYYSNKGLDVIRLPFLWERVQKSQFAALDSTELARIDEVVNYASSKGLKVVIDAHGYGRGFGSLIGSGGTSDAAFADFWGKMAGHYASNPNVVFGLMNEPNQQNASTWLKSANAAIGAIRQSGATNEILVPGSYWDGAWTWTTSDNAAVVGTGIKDPLNNFAFEVHQYLDQDGSGTHRDVVSDSVGVERLKAITQWAEATGNKLFLGEFGVANDSTSLTALDKMLAYMKQNESVWQGATYWAGGPWWGNYMYSAEPSGGQDKPQLSVLQKYA